MLKKILIALIYFSLLSHCKREIPIEGFNAQEWKNDKLGCKGERNQQVATLLEQKNMIMGLTEAEILKTMGRPDFQELSKRNQKFYYYYLISGPQCKQGLSGAKENTFQIRFNSLGYANEIVLNTE